MERFCRVKNQHERKVSSNMEQYFSQNKEREVKYVLERPLISCENDNHSNFDSSPSFYTEEQASEDDFLHEYNMASQFSEVSSFSESKSENQMSERELKQKITLNNNQDQSYIPSLESYYSISSSQEEHLYKESEQDLNFINEHHLNSLSSLQLPSKEFLPNITSLTQHIDFLEKQHFIIKKEYQKLKSFTEAIIDALKTIGSESVANSLEEYMNKNIYNPNIFSLLNSENYTSTSYRESQLSKEFASKLSQESLSYSHEFESKQLSDTIENIFTLAGESNNFIKNSISSSPSNQSCKSTERKNKNFKKIKNNKENISNLNISQNSTSKKIKNNENNKSFIKIDKISKAENEEEAKNKKLKNKIVDNESMKYLLNDFNKDESTCNSNKKFSKRSETARNQSIATELMCEVCQHCYLPNEFFNHLNKCSKLETETSKESEKNDSKNLNYTLVMENLFYMRGEIQEQIEMLESERQKSKINEKYQREKLKQKLLLDLEKITTIIKTKEREMQIYSAKGTD